MKPRLRLLLFSFLILSFFISCEREPDARIEYSLSDVELMLEGPLFQGANDVQTLIPFPLEEALAREGFDRQNIQDIRISSVSLRREDADNFNIFESVVLQLTAAGAPLTSVAVLSPVPEGRENLELEPSQQASLRGFRDAEEVYVVVDANLAEDYEDDIVLKADIVFLLEVRN